MATGYFIGLGDKTSCGGKVLEGETGMMFSSVPRAYEGHRVTCGENGKTYVIVGGISSFRINGKRAAGTLDSVSSCPCKAKLIASITHASYRSEAGAAPLSAPAPQRAAEPVSVAERPIPRPSGLTPASPPTMPGLSGSVPAEPGFYLVPKSISREALRASLLPVANAEVLRKFHSLNPGSDLVKAGTMIVLSDPHNLQCTREEAMLMAAATTANEIVETLSAEEADFMMRHRDEISTFLGYGSTAMGISQVIFARHLKGIEDLFQQMNDLHRRTFQKHGHLRAPEFFAERKQLLSQLDLHLNGVTRRGIGLQDHPKLKTALGISSRSLVHHWSHAGVVDHLPGHASHISGLARASKIINAGGWVGTVVGGGASYLKVQEVCSAGETEACKRVRFTEAGGFSAGLLGSVLVSKSLIAAAPAICVAIGVGTLGVGGIACGVVVVGAGSYAASKVGEKVGSKVGDVLYEKLK